MKKLVLFLVYFIFAFCLLFVISVYQAQAATYDLTTQYNLRIDGTYANQRIGFPYIDLADINNNGKDDFVIYSDTEDAIYVISDQVALAAMQGDRKIDISEANNYLFKITSSKSFAFKDIDNDNKLDVVISNHFADSPGKSDNGEVYIINNEVLNSVTVGTSFSAADATKYSFVIRGENNGDYFGDTSVEQILVTDIDNDDKNDLIINARGTDYQASNGGSVYIIPNSVVSGSSIGNVVEMSDSNNYRVRIDSGLVGDYGYGLYNTNIFPGPTENSYLLISCSIWANNQIRYRSGSCYMIPSDLIPGGTGNNLDLSNSLNYSHMIIGGYESAHIYLEGGSISDRESSSNLGTLLVKMNNGNQLFFSNNLINELWTERGQLLDLADATNYTNSIGNAYHFNSIGDYSGNGVTDYIFSHTAADDNGTNTGSSYLVTGETFQHHANSHINLDLQEPSNQMIKWMGDSSPESIAVSQHTSPTGDLNGDDKPDFIFLTDWTAYNGSRSGSSWLILNFPHTITASGLGGSINSQTPVVTGTASAPLSISTIGGVQWSLDNNPTSGWHECAASDGAFDSTSEDYSCDVEIGDEGSKKIYIRAYDENRSYTAVSKYASLSTSADRTGPSKTFTVIGEDGKEYQREFKQLSLINQEVVGYNHYPQFCFSVAGDTGSGIKEYRVKVDGLDYIDNISANPPPAGDNGDTFLGSIGNTIKQAIDKWIDWTGFDKLSKEDKICSYGKGDGKYLNAGLHTWEVVAKDEAGNETSIGKEKFLVNTHSGSVGKNEGKYYPLSILQIGNKTNLTYSTENPELFTASTKALTITDTTPIVYGIASVGSRITLKIDQDTINSTGDSQREQVFTQNTDVNINSEWGINITEPLAVGTYYFTIEAADDYDNYAIVKDILVKVGVNSIPVTNTSVATESAVLGESVDLDEGQTVNLEPPQPSPSPQPTSSPQPTPIAENASDHFAPTMEVSPQRSLHENIFDAVAGQVLKLIK